MQFQKPLKKAAIGIAAAVMAFFAIVSMNEFRYPELVLRTGGSSAVRLPILMYHSILQDPERTGPYVLQPETLRSDLLWLKNHGYTTVTVQDLIDYIHRDRPLPAKPVMITLDDGYLNNRLYVLPVLQELDMKAVLSVVGSLSERFSDTPDPNPNYAHLTWDDLRFLQESGHFEIQNHSYDMHRLKPRAGSARMAGETPEAYRRALLSDMGRNQKLLFEHCGAVPTAYTYPYGKISRESMDIVKEAGFLASFSCYEKVNYLEKTPEALYLLNRFNRPGGVGTEEFMAKIEAN